MLIGAKVGTGTYVYCLGVDGLVPSRIEETNTGRDVSPQTITGLNVCGVLRDTVIDRVDGLNKFLL